MKNIRSFIKDVFMSFMNNPKTFGIGKFGSLNDADGDNQSVYAENVKSMAMP